MPAYRHDVRTARVPFRQAFDPVGVSLLEFYAHESFAFADDLLQFSPLLGGFSLSLIFMLASLTISLREILISVHALNLELSDMQNDNRPDSELHR